jgi:colicin import membrane protein
MRRLVRIRVHWVWLLAACAAMATAVRAADGDPSDKARRDLLNVDRAAAQARYDQTVRECQRAFAVTDCVNRAKSERRAALDRVSREQAALDDAERKRRAEERQQRIAKKQAQQAQQAKQSQRSVDTRAAASAPPLQVRAPRQASSAASVPAKPARRAEPRTPEAAAAAEAEAAERAALSQQRRERAQAHEEAVRKRNAERAAQRPPAAPLPVPQASGAASAIR